MAGTLPLIQLPGYDEELNRAELDIARLKSLCGSHPRDLEKRVRLSYRLFHRASVTGIMFHFDAVDTAIRGALVDFGPCEDLCLLKANLDFRFHRLADVRRDLNMCPLLPERFEGRVILAGVDFEEGRYEAARLELERLITENRTWDNLARLAQWQNTLEDMDEAVGIMESTENHHSDKHMRSYS